MKRQRISDGWMRSVNKGAERRVDLPDDFVITLPRVPSQCDGYAGFYPTADGVYHKYIGVSEKTRHLLLDIEGAYQEATVSWNGEVLAVHHHGYTPFLVNPDAALRRGENNLIKIEVLSSHLSTRWYAGGGLYRDVYLWEGGAVRVEPWDLFVTTREADAAHAVIDADMKILADFDGEVLAHAEILDAEGKRVAREEVCVSLSEGEKTPCRLTLEVREPALWSDGTPYLYTMKITLTSPEGEVYDTASTDFGIRTISFDAAHGFRVNGKSVKLRGGCMHHTHGALGAADFVTAVERQLRGLKAAGFNAIRSSHNPPSETLLTLCDKLGFYLMDEAFDMWRMPKSRADYHLHFDACFREDIAEMVLHARNHPSVISYSIGNEIRECDGTSGGYALSRLLSDEIRKYDRTRPVTAAVCGVYESPRADAPEDYAKSFMKGYTDIGRGERPGVFGEDSWLARTEQFMEPLDIVGYNYKHYRYAYDHEKFPDRVIWGSETWALTFYDSWRLVEKYPHVIGDFCWTCYDSLGENGTGRSLWAREGRVDGISVAGYEWISCFQGDFDLAGFRRPQSYFREAIWRGAKDAVAKIFTTHPEHTGEGFTGTGWHWYDVHESWTFDDRYLGGPTKAEIYTTADAVRWYLNGRAVGESVPEGAIASILLPYERGTLEAALIVNGEEVKRATLRTTGEACDFALAAEKSEIAADNRDLCYVTVRITDGAGAPVTVSGIHLSALVTGGELLGLFSGDPKAKDPIASGECDTFDGTAVAVLRTDRAGTVTLTVKALGKEHSVSVFAK